MKLIIAYIQPERLEEVTSRLAIAEIGRVSVTNALGCGSQGGYTENYRGARLEVNLLKKVRLEIAINDAYKDLAIEAITEGARTGNIGDGKIFVLELGECIRIRTGESGGEAIG